MAEHTEDQDDEVRALIRAHLVTHSPIESWAPVEDAAALLGYTPAEVNALIRPIVAARAADRTPLMIDVSLPAAEQPATPKKLERDPVESAPLQSYIQRLKRIDGDAQKVRDASLGADARASGGFRIIKPMQFLAALHHQQEALKLHMKIGATLFDLDRVERYFKRLGEIIRDRTADLDPAIRDAIMNDMDALNEEFLNEGANGV